MGRRQQLRRRSRRGGGCVTFDGRQLAAAEAMLLSGCHRAWIAVVGLYALVLECLLLEALSLVLDFDKARAVS